MNNQYNALTKEFYQGKNQAELQAAKAELGFESDAWVTFLQARELGRKVIKRSKSPVRIFLGFAKFDTTVKTDEGKEKTKTESRPLGTKPVFNIDQTEAIEVVEEVQNVAHI